MNLQTESPISSAQRDPSTGGAERREAQACRCEQVATVLGHDLIYWREHLSAEQIADAQARVARLHAEAAEWRGQNAIG